METGLWRGPVRPTGPHLDGTPLITINLNTGTSPVLLARQTFSGISDCSTVARQYLGD